MVTDNAAAAQIELAAVDMMTGLPRVAAPPCPQNHSVADIVADFLNRLLTGVPLWSSGLESLASAYLFG